LPSLKGKAAGNAEARNLCRIGWSERNGPPGPAGNLYEKQTSDLFRKRNIGWKKFWNISGNKNWM